MAWTALLAESVEAQCWRNSIKSGAVVDLPLVARGVSIRSLLALLADADAHELLSGR
jgi:hypothetical protein